MADINRYDKAIEILEKDLSFICKHGTEKDNDVIESLEMSINTLKELGEREKGCDTCKNDSITIHISAFKAMAVCNERMNHGAFDITIKPKFCPNCGREL